MSSVTEPDAIIRGAAATLGESAVTIARLQRDLARAREQHAQDVATISRMFCDAACEYDLCDAFESTINLVNPHLVGPTKLQHRSCDCC